MGLWDIDKIPYVGREKGPQEGLAFHYYDADKVVAGKKMKDWLRFGVAWWHTFDQELVDPVRHRHRPASVVRQVFRSGGRGPGQGRLRLRVLPEARRRVLLLP